MLRALEQEMLGVAVDATTVTGCCVSKFESDEVISESAMSSQKLRRVVVDQVNCYRLSNVRHEAMCEPTSVYSVPV